MTKTVCITLNVDIPDSELTKNATVAVGTNTYQGTIVAIMSHTVTIAPAETTVTLKAPGLAVEP